MQNTLIEFALKLNCRMVAYVVHELFISNNPVGNFSNSMQIRGSIMVSISACHAEDPGSIPGRGECSSAWTSALTINRLACSAMHQPRWLEYGMQYWFNAQCTYVRNRWPIYLTDNFFTTNLKTADCHLKSNVYKCTFLASPALLNLAKMNGFIGRDTTICI